MELKFHKLNQIMFDAFASVDMNGYIVDCNEYFLSMLGYLPDEIKMLTYKEITPEIWHQMETDIIEKQVLTRGYSDIYEKEYRRKDGTVFPVELRIMLLRDAKGAPVHMWSIVRDISERKRSEKALQERIRELNCLYSIADLIEKIESLDVLLQNVVNQMSQCWHYPEYVCARITLEDQEFKTKNFQETDWKLSAKLIACGKPIGVVDVYYLDKIIDRNEGPFIEEERNLIKAIAERLGRVIERKRYEEERERLIFQLKEALSKIKKLSGLLPICASCKKIRDDSGYWNQLESYISSHSEAEFSHGLCPECTQKLLLDFDEEEKGKL